MRILLTATLVVFQLATTNGAEAATAAQKTSKQIAATAQTVSGMPFARTFIAPGNLALQQMGAKKLPPTRLDSFVAESGFDDSIYGDEGTDGPPPYLNFETYNRINAGIYADRDLGLTTNHGSKLASAWGKDEFIGGPEWSISGPSGVQGPTPHDQKKLVLPPKLQPQQPAINPWADSDPNADSPTPSEPNPNDPNNLPPGYIGVYQHGYFLGSYNPEVDSFESFLQREHPKSYQTFLQQTGGGWGS